MAAPLVATVARHSIRFLGHPLHSHPEPHLIHLVRGTGVAVADGQRYELGVGETLWLQPEVPHSLHLDVKGIAFGPMLGPYAAPPTRVHRLGVVPELAELMLVILAASPTDEEVEPFRRAIEQLLARLVATTAATLPLPEHPTARRIAQQMIAGDITTLSATLPDLAADHFLSVRQIQRLWLESTRLTFVQWRTRARLDHATRALDGGQSVDDAVRLSGYRTRDGLLKALRRRET